MKCKNCKHARMTANEEHIACELMSSAKHDLVLISDTTDKHGNLIRPYDFYDLFLNFVKFRNEDEIYECHSYLACKSGFEPKGWLKNYCVILPKNNFCNFYEDNIK